MEAHTLIWGGLCRNVERQPRRETGGLRVQESAAVIVGEAQSPEETPAAGLTSPEALGDGLTPLKDQTEEQDRPMTTTKATKPNGGANACLAMDPSALNANLMERVLDPENLRRAWRQVKANRGAPGIDGMTIEQFPDFVRSPQWSMVKGDLGTGIFGDLGTGIFYSL